jgi:uncharacterized protein YcbX
MVAQLTTRTSLVLTELPMPAVRLLVGGHASRVQGERQDLAGDRMFTAAHPANARGIETWASTAIAPLTPYQNDQVLKLAGQSFRSRRYRAQRTAQAEQSVLW